MCVCVYTKLRYNTNMAQSHNQPNCGSVDIFCLDDKDCFLHCASAAHNISSHSTIFDDDEHSVVSIYTCNKSTKKCEPNNTQKGFYDMALNDFHKLIEKKDKIPKSLYTFLNIYGGKKFIQARARFYEILSLHLCDGEKLDKIIQSIKIDHAKERKAYLYNKIQQLKNTGTVSDQKEIQQMLNWAFPSSHLSLPNSNYTITMENYLKNIFGKNIVSGNKKIIIRDIEHDNKRGEYSALVAKMHENHYPSSNSNNNNNDINIKEPHKFYCNEEMGAGIMMAAFKDENNILPICVCLHPEYLTGPTCKHRTYTSVIDYDLWEETGIPEYLTDPINDYRKANNICKKTTPNTTAVFDERESGGKFKCQPLAAHFAQSLQLRGPYEPALVLDRDFIDSLNNNRQGFKVNIDYLDLLRKFH
nr:MAG: wsv306-like protein [Metapenaeopsis lamellata majanivirus]